ncbi:phage late control D family protein [Qipengyuania mesophila]|uniref:phage late control D family protein n=1 Tax=Qipengyuania mesophila TaxID=2867246 RepID=UPI0035179E29
MARDDPPTLFSARPTVRIGTMEYPMLADQVTAMEMREATGGMSSLEISFTDWVTAPDGSAGYGALGSDQPFKLGEEIAVYAGPSGGPQEIFKGLITALESEVCADRGPQLTVLAEDLLFTMRRARRSRLFEDMSPKMVVEQIAGEYSLTPQVRDGLDDPVKTWAQLAETDLAFLRRVLALLDADLQLVGTDLQVGPVARDQRTEVELAFPDKLVALRATADLADQFGETSVSGMDIDAGEQAEASMMEGELGPGEGGLAKDILARKFQPYRNHLKEHGPVDVSWAQAMAKSAHGRQARKFLRAHGTAVGDPRIRVGSWLTLTGLNPMFANQYVVAEAVHRFDLENGYQTDFVAECARFGGEA